MPKANQSIEGAAAEAALPFEDALKKLEDIVESMESGDLPLEGLLVRFEEGTRLVKACQTKLEEAELRISKLEKAGGDFVVTPGSEVGES